MTSIHFKKTASEKIQLKKIKKEHFKNMKALNPLVTKAKSLFGFRTNEMSQINVIIDLANKAKAALS